MMDGQVILKMPDRLSKVTLQVGGVSSQVEGMSDSNCVSSRTSTSSARMSGPSSASVNGGCQTSHCLPSASASAGLATP